MRVLSLGGGVQSTTLALMAVEDELSLDAVVFADTGAEPEYVYRHIRWLRETLQSAGIPLHVVENGHILRPKLRFAALPLYVRNRQGQKAMLRRQCTLEYKVRPIRKWLKAHGATAQNPALLAIGISLDEVQRMRDSEVRYVQHWYPLIDRRMQRADCVMWLQSHNYPVPKKSSCVMCPFHSDAYWRMLKREHPEEFERACQIDEQFRRVPRVDEECFVHRSLKPLRVIDFDAQGELDLGGAEECTGYCLT